MADHAQVEDEGWTSPQPSQTDPAQRSEEHLQQLVASLGGQAHGFFLIGRTRFSGGVIETPVVMLLAEAALSGVVGNSVYDGVRLTLRAIARRWRARREQDKSAQPSREEVAELLCAAVRLRLKLNVDITLAIEELNDQGQGQWRAVVRNIPNNESYIVRLTALHLEPDGVVDHVSLLIQD